jgi:hypothetical protein
VREDRTLYERAVARAWQQIETRLGEIAAAAPGRKLYPVAVEYEHVPGEPVIEELPDTAKSSRPRAVTAAVRLRATYALR